MAIEKLSKSRFLNWLNRYIIIDKVNETIDAVNDALPVDGTINADTISEETTGAGVTVDSVLIKDGYVISKPTPVAKNVTATLTAAEMLSGYITSTSAAAVALTTPTATALAALIPGVGVGTNFDFIIDNTTGANTVTLTLDASIAVVTPAITGGATLTVSTSNDIGIFRIVFTSETTAKIFRIA
jgi:hypothetical protein